MTPRGGTAPEGQPEDNKGGRKKPVPPGRGDTLPPAKRRAIEEAGREALLSGRSVRSIAKEFGVAPSTVTRIFQRADPPIVVDRSKTAPATEARIEDMKARRAKIAEQALDEVTRMLGLLTQPHTVIGWHQGTAGEHVIDRPTSSDVKNYAIAIGIMLDKHQQLARFDSDDRELSAVDAWLDHITGGAAS